MLSGTVPVCIELCASRQLSISIDTDKSPQDVVLKEGNCLGHRLDGIPVLTCELVAAQIEERELTQLPYALRNRACAYRKVRMSSVADFNWYKYTASGCGPQGHCLQNVLFVHCSVKNKI